MGRRGILDFSFVTCMLLVGVKRSSTVVRMASKTRSVGISEFGSTGLNDTLKSQSGGRLKRYVIVKKP